MGKKKGKKTAGAEEKTEAEIPNITDSIEANGDHAAAPTKNLTTVKKKKKEDGDDDIADEFAQLSLNTPGQNVVESHDPGDSSKKKKKKKNKEAERESPEPKEEGEDDEPEFFEPSDDERSKKKKKKKGKQQPTTQSPEPTQDADNNEPEFFEPSDDEKKKKKGKQQPTRQSPEPSQDMENNEPEFFEPSDDEKKKKKKKAEPMEEKAEDGEDQEISTVKTKAQKLAEKKERERKKKQEKAKKGAKTKDKTEEVAEKTGEEKIKDSGDVAETEGLDVVDTKEEKTSKKKKKDKKEKKGEIDAKSRKKPGNKAIAAMQEALRKQKEEEERLKFEEDEKERKEEEARQARIDKVEEDKLRKERKKQKAKERIKRLKAEGKYLTPTQKEAQRKREAYVESLREQGLLPVSNKQKPKYDNLSKTMKKNRQSPVDEKVQDDQVKQEEEVVEMVEEAAEMAEEAAEDDDIVDDWEAVLEDPEEATVEKDTPEAEIIDEDDGGEEEEEEESDEESEEESSEEESEEEEDDDLTPRQRAERRIELRKEKCEHNRSTDDLRSPVICVMGHVDTGKTKILDKIRHSHVQDGEAGGITQQIGATFVPLETIREQTSMVKSFQEFNVSLPGLLIIDTPGHESFSNLRSRGSSVCDMAILVVDIMHGLESQTIESINMLKKRKTPFVVALNKVDRLYDWKRGPDSDIVNTIKKQKRHVKEEFEEKVREIVVEFAKQNLNVKLFHENDDPKEWISMVPTSAHSGDGMGNLIALVMQLCQTMLPKRLAFSEELQCTVLEVKQIPGLGTTIDLILTNGRLNCGDTIVLAGVEGPIVSHIKALLMPQPLKELRVKNPYDKFDNLKAAQGVKILAKDLDKALAGTQLLVAHKDDEIEILKAEVQAEVEKTLKSIKLQERGVFVQASTLGSLEALLEFLKQSKIPFAGIGIGPVHKKDIMKASVMLEHDSQWAVILAFDVKVDRETQELADSLRVRIFTADIIYHLFDAFMQHREDLKKQKQEEFRSIAVFPCKLRIMPNCVFKSRDPIIIGVTIDAGQLRPRTPICIPLKEFLMVGYVTSMEFNHKQLEIARAGQEVCIKIECTPGETPKMVGRHFEETDILVSKITRDSIDALKNWFRDEMQKSDWQLIIELKKMFEIM